MTSLDQILKEFGHDSVQNVSTLDGLDIIAVHAEGWVAELASLLYFKEISKLTPQ